MFQAEDSQFSRGLRLVSSSVQTHAQNLFDPRPRPWMAAGCWMAVALLAALPGGAASAQVSPGSPSSLPGTGAPGQTGAVSVPGQPATVPQASTAVTPGTSAVDRQDALGPIIPALTNGLGEFSGLKVSNIRYDGVDFVKTDKLLSELPQKSGEPLDPMKVRETTRRLFATGRYRNISVRVERTGEEVTLIFTGVPRYYIGRVQINGVKQDRLASLLEYGTQLNPGTAYTPAQIPAATEGVKSVLAQNGYYEPVVRVKTDRDDKGQQVNVTYDVSPGPQARVGTVTLQGKDPGITVDEFRKKAKLNSTLLRIRLKRNPKVNRDTTSDALTNIRGFYQRNNRLEATVSLQKTQYDAGRKELNYTFLADQGPTVKVVVEGARISKSRLKLLVPIFEEGTIDNDLLNEGRYKIQDFLEQSGYFDAGVKVSVIGEDTPSETVLYAVDKGVKHKVVDVTVVGNKYFSTADLKERLRVQKADAYARSGRYSRQLEKVDESNLEALYKANGFKNAKVTAETNDTDDKAGKDLRVALIGVHYKVDEGVQQTFGSVDLKGVDPARENSLQGLLGTQKGQPFSLITLSGDRDSILAYYLSNGFDQAKVEVKQTPQGENATATDVSFNVTEGKQVFVGRVLESGIHYTKPRTVDNQLTLHAGDPLDQSALLETQRNLYNLALFNEVIAAVQNPAGNADIKNVLVQITEAKRWDVTYGFGFEAQTGVPSRGQYSTQLGRTAAQQGTKKPSARVLLDISRINLFGTDNSLTLHTTYGLLETVATLSFQNPHLFGNKRFSAQISGGYTNVQDITTFASSTLQGDFRVTHRPERKDTFIYDFVYRRVAVDPNSLAISSNLIPLLSQPVRVGGPQISWYHDTRTPSLLDANKGIYFSLNNFLATSAFGSQTDFNRTDVTQSTFYHFGKKPYVFARSTRFGVIRDFGTNPNAQNPSQNIADNPCAGSLLNTNASCNAVPLPERLYAGGASSHRGFSINGAGPRDLTTGYPVGGSAVFINTLELRLPPPVLPYVGDSISFVVFHDMGNVFQHLGDLPKSFGRFRQPNEDSCRNVSGIIGTCDFNYFSHAVGLGARYRTPVGPIRFDLSYNLNPPIYPVFPSSFLDSHNVLQTPKPYVGQASHFNFFFSIGQSF